MNHLIKSHISILIAFLLSSHIEAAENQLQKVFCHKGSEKFALDLGKIVFYFAHKPIIKQVLPENNKNKKQTQVLFSIDQTKITSAECEQMVEECNRSKNPLYAINIKQVVKPAPSIQMTISYDPELVSFAYESFEAITKQPGLVFTFYNKKNIDKLKNKPSAVLTTVSNNAVPTIVIDAGHGGHDIGASGFFNIQEKNLTKTMGDLLAQYLQTKGWHVVLTRKADDFVALGERTTCANKSGADMMISLHANYSVNEQASGIETFCLDSSLFTFLGSSNKNGNSFRKVTSDNSMKLSNLLASSIHRNVIELAHQKRDSVVDRKVKHAVSQILLGSAIPTVLIELGFISNKQDAYWLVSPAYQLALIEGIYAGIKNYLDQKQMVL